VRLVRAAEVEISLNIYLQLKLHCLLRDIINMVETTWPIDINLGFLKKPKNSLIMTSPYFPSKFGGKPAWLHPEKTPTL
jgi:hypothetical protein